MPSKTTSTPPKSQQKPSDILEDCTERKSSEWQGLIWLRSSPKWSLPNNLDSQDSLHLRLLVLETPLPVECKKVRKPPSSQDRLIRGRYRQHQTHLQKESQAILTTAPFEPSH